MARYHASPVTRHHDRPAPLAAVLAITILASLGTGVLWNGIGFIAKHDYGYTQRQSFLLLLFSGVLYTLAAFGASRLARAVEARVSPRGLLAALFALQALASGALVVPDAPWLLWLAAGLNSVGSAILWPLVESYLTAGRHGPRMRSALGWWNVAWTTTVPVALILMAPLVERDLARLAVAALAPANLINIAVLAALPPRPGRHDAETAESSITPVYPFLLRCARVLLPTSYVLVGALSPLMPYLLAGLEVEARWETPITSTWMIARIAALGLMWRTGFWHGRWGTLLLGGALLAVGFADVALARGVPILLIGLVAFGAGQGTIYYAALYYAMSVGHAEVEAAGTHEGLIGVGYVVGPLSGLIAFTFAEGRAGATLMLAIIGVIVAVAALAAAREYARARRLTAA